MRVFITRKLPEVAKKVLVEKFEVYGGNKNEPCSGDRLKDIVANYDAVL